MDFTKKWGKQQFPKMIFFYMMLSLAWLFFFHVLVERLSSGWNLGTFYFYAKDGIFVLITAAVLFVFMKHLQVLHARDLASLKVSEQRYKSLFNNNPEIVCSFDLTGIVTSVNPAVEKVLGYQVEEVVSQYFPNFVLERDWEDAYADFTKVLEGEQRTSQVSVKHKNGDVVDLSVIGVPIIVDQQTEGVFLIATDITEYNKTQELLRKTDKLNVVGELAAGIAHEIRNPLTSLKGFVQLLRPDLKKNKEYTDVMLSELDRIEQIVTELLLLTKPQPAQFKEKDLKKLLEHVRTLLNIKAVMSHTEIMLDYRSDVTRIFCGENQLKQVLINLLKNAIEAMPQGGEIKIEVEDTDEEKVCIRVIDEGDGIPEDQITKLGEPFYTTKEQGTGLGLMISQKMIKEHGGTMVFKSRLGEGTTVEITLPVSPVATYPVYQDEQNMK